MNITMDHDSICSFVRVRPGRKCRPRTATMATANAPSSASTGQGCVVNALDQTRTSVASARHRISMDRVLRILSRAGRQRGGHRTGSAHRRYLQLLDGTLDVGIALLEGQRGIRRSGRSCRGGRIIGLAREFDVGGDSPMVDRYAGGGVVERCGEFDGAIAR